MLAALSSNAITAKARAIYGRRLTNANYMELLRLQTVGDVCNYLKVNTSYSHYLSGVNDTSIHRGQLENILQRSRLEKFFRLCNYDFTRNKGFYNYVISNVEVSIILRALMLINSGSSEDIITDLPVFLQEYTSINFKEIAKVRSFDDLLAVLDKTPYNGVLKPYEAPNGEINFRECEHSLKLFYYKTVLEQIDQFYRGKTRKELRDIVLIEIELLNLSLIYRLRSYFNKPPEDIKRQLLPFHYKLNSRALDILLQSQQKEEYIQKMRLAAYNNNMRGVEFNYIEDYTKRLKYIISRKMIRFSTNAPISFYSLMTLLQIEIDNLTIIIEGIRYNTSSQVQNLLILE